ncbi:unnamed protein product [Closterium sp. NIES-53]
MTSRLTSRYLTTVSFPTALPLSPPSPLFLAPDPVEPFEVAVDSGAARGAEPAGEGTGGAELGVPVSEGVEPGGAESGGAELGGAEPGSDETGGVGPERAKSRGPPGVPSRREPLSPRQLCEWYTRRCRRAAGAGAAGGAAGTAGAAGAAGAAGGAVGGGAAGGTSGAGAAGPGGAAGGTGGVGGLAGVGAAGGARTGGTGAAGAVGAAGVGAAGARAVATGGASGAGAVRGTRAGGAAGVVAGDPRAEGTRAISAVPRGAAGPRPYYVSLLRQVLGLPPSPGPTPRLVSPSPVQSQLQLQPASPLPGPSPYSGQTRGLTKRRDPESRPLSPESRSASPVCSVRSCHRVTRPHPPPVPGNHSMTLRPSTAPQRVPLPSPPASSLPDGPGPESDSLRAASPTITRFLATAVTDPLFESTAASALVAELVDFAAACSLDYATSLVAESASASVSPPSVRGECALGTDVLEDRQEDFECSVVTVPHLVSMLLAPEGDPDAPDIPTPRSYAEAIEGLQAPTVKRPPGSPPVFKARYVARGFSQRQGVDIFQTFSPTPKMTTLRVLLHVAAQRDYELRSLDFSTAFLQCSLHEEIWLRRPPGFTGSFPAGTQWSLQRPVYGLRQAPREWHDTLRTTLSALGFSPSTADPSLFLHTDTTLLPFCVLVYVDDLVFANADTEALAHVKSFSASASRTPRHSRLLCLPDTRSQLHLRTSPTSGMELVLGGRARVVLTGHADASWVGDLATQRSSQGYTFCLDSGSVSLRSTRSSSFLSSSCEVEIYAGAMAAQELRWLTYLLTDLGEAPRSPPVLYVDNKAMLAFCQEHRLEHRTKHIALRYFLARELQQRGQLRLAYVASRANTADVFTKALQPCDHQRFCTVLGLVPTVPHLLTS